MTCIGDVSPKEVWQRLFVSPCVGLVKSPLLEWTGNLFADCLQKVCPSTITLVGCNGLGGDDTSAGRTGLLWIFVLGRGSDLEGPEQLARGVMVTTWLLLIVFSPGALGWDHEITTRVLLLRISVKKVWGLWVGKSFQSSSPFLSGVAVHIVVRVRWGS